MNRYLVIAGVALIVLGLLPFRLGSLPGDFAWRGRNTAFYFPLGSSILLSLLLTLLLWLANRFR